MSFLAKYFTHDDGIVSWLDSQRLFSVDFAIRLLQFIAILSELLFIEFHNHRNLRLLRYVYVEIR